MPKSHRPYPPEFRRQMVEFLLKRGAATNLPGDQPWATPLAWARKRGDGEMAVAGSRASEGQRGLSSGIFEGVVAHRRLAPRQHAFRYRVFAMLLDLDELPGLGLRFFQYNRWGLFSFQDKDHGDGRDLDAWLDDLLAQKSIVAKGARRVLCYPRILGYVFNPISVWFCDDEAGRLFGDALMDAAKKGVKVRVLVDAWGSKMGKLGDELKDAGVDLRSYRPVNPFTIHKISKRTHRKIMVIDGRISFTGGMCIDKRWLGSA